MRPKRVFAGAALAGFVALLPSLLGAWGETGHRLINRNAILLLPEPLKAVYSKHKRIILDQSVAPDEWKREDRFEGPRHYINIDIYEKYPFPGFPMTYANAVSKFNKKTVEEAGTLPWRIGEYYEMLVEAFRQRDRRGIAEVSGQLGHYIGDLYQPLHATADYDGQLSGARGVHQYFEEKMVDAYKKDFKFNASSRIGVIGNLPEFVLTVIREGYPEVAKIMAADQAGRTDGKKRDSSYMLKLYKNAGPIAWRRIQSASEALASVWYSAWVDAGKPDLK